MFSQPESITAAQKKQFDTMLTLANSAFSSAERLIELNLSTSRRMLEEFASSTQSALGAKNVQEVFALQSDFAQPWLEKVASYNRSVFEIATQGQQEVSTQLETQVAEARKNVSSAIDEAARSAPAGSYPAVAAIKTAFIAASNAYDTVYGTAKKLAGAAEANLTAATDATTKASADMASQASAAAQGKKADA